MQSLKRLAMAAVLSAAVGFTSRSPVVCAPAADTAPAPVANDIFDPNRAPIIILHIGIHRLVLIPKSSGSETTVGTVAIENKANSTSFSSIIASSVAGVAAAPSGEIHIRGSHGQYTYYLDGAPLPESVSGSFSDLIDPKNIQTLKVYTGGFPASYGGNLAAVFDVTAKAGEDGPPHGYVQQIVEGYQTFDSTLQTGGGVQRLTYFLSGVRDFTNRRLDPLTEDPIHDAGNDAVAFGKFDYQAGRSDQVILDTADTADYFQLPNTPDRQAVGQDDTQKENGDFANLIWHHTPGTTSLTTVLYNHHSSLRYFPSAGDLVGATPDNPLATASEDRTSSYYGMRIDFIQPFAKNHKLALGTDDDTVTGHEDFALTTADGVNPNQTVLDSHSIAGNDEGGYIEDTWTPGRWNINYGARYDIHKVDTTTSQVSPRLNLGYVLGKHDKLHAYYDKLFQPAPVEDIRKLDPNAAPFKPERDDFFEVGLSHNIGKFSTTYSAYYRDEKDVIDENIIAGTQIREPFNVQKGYVRGLEFTVGGNIVPTVSMYANFARSWAKSAGDFTGGFLPVGAPPGYFYDDHDQTNTASLGTEYDKNGTFLSIDGEYGSGFPYGQDAAGDVNFLRVPPHFIFDLSTGAKVKSSDFAFTVTNLLNHPYVIKEAGVFSDVEWGQARTFGMKYTLNF